MNNKYNWSKEEREKLLMVVLKRIRSIGKEPLWLHKRRNEATWNKLSKVYGEYCLRDIIHILEELNLIQSQGANKPFTITERGKEYYKRGWIETKINKYDNPKYPLFISIAALAVSVFSSEYFWKAIHWIHQAIVKLLST